MKLFKRQQKNVSNSVIPQEIQDYSQTEHREKMGIATLVGFISLILTLTVLFGMFVGGRWMYRKIAGTDTKSNSTTVVEKSPEETKEASKQDIQKDASNASEAAASSPSSPAQQSENPTTPAAPSSALPTTGPDLDL
jgi:cytoskeletal protein RodZ